MIRSSQANPALQPAHTELARAFEARANGNEGMARVCARRAAGQAVAVYVEFQHLGKWGASALERLAGLTKDEEAPAEVRAAATRLTTRITPDHVLPFEQDPLDDARRIIAFVEGVVSV